MYFVDSQDPWPQYDLGTARQMGGFTLKHAGAGGEWADFNTREYSIHISSSSYGPWTQAVSYTNSSKLNITTHTLAAPVSARYVKLYVGVASFIDNFARIPEIDVWTGNNYTTFSQMKTASSYYGPGYVDDPLRYSSTTYSYQTFVTAYRGQGLAVGTGL